MVQVAAMILAAGKGTRMKSAVSKMLHPLLGLPLLSYPLRALETLDIDRQVVVIGSSGQEVMDRFGAWPGVCFAWQREQKGTADAAAKALGELEEFSGDILIVCGDVPLLRAETLAGLLRRHQQAKAVVSVLSAVLPDGEAYGRLVLNADGELMKIVEARDASPAELEICRINSGIYCVDADFLRQALGTQGMPANQLLVGLALFLTFYIMSPVWKQINDEALQPYLRHDITQSEAFDRALVPIRKFMFSQVREKDLSLFVFMAKMDKPANPDEIPTLVLIPAFIISIAV